MEVSVRVAFKEGGANKTSPFQEPVDLWFAEKPVFQEKLSLSGRRYQGEMLMENGILSIKAARHQGVVLAFAKLFVGLQIANHPGALGDFKDEIPTRSQCAEGVMQQLAVVLLIGDLPQGSEQTDCGIEFISDGEVFATQPEELWWFAFRGRIFLCSSNHGRRGIDAEYIEAAPGEFDAMATEPAADIDESIPRCCWQDRKDKIDFSGSSTPGQQGVCQVG